MKTRIFALILWAALTNIAFTACSDDDDDEEEATSEFDSHAVDLGLPSGLLWADQNVGANSPEDFGYSVAWGEPEPKNNYSWATYRHGTANNALTKYVRQTDADELGKGGFYDNKTILDKEDDAAAVAYGGKWRTPTDEEWAELIENSTWEWMEHDGVNGYHVTGPSGESIFLPAAGCSTDSRAIFKGSYGYYWSSSLSSDASDHAGELYFMSGSYLNYSYLRTYGHSVRGVRSK